MPLSRETVAAWVANSSGTKPSGLFLATTDNHPTTAAGAPAPPTSPTVPDDECVDMEISFSSSRQDSGYFSPENAGKISQLPSEAHGMNFTGNFGSASPTGVDHHGEG